MGRRPSLGTEAPTKRAMKEEVKMYLERAEKFRKNAEFNFENGDYDIAMFHIEQACQLMINKGEAVGLEGILRKDAQPEETFR